MRKTALALGMILLASCSINDRVEPLSVSKVTKLCLKTNKAVHMSGFLPEIIHQFERHGVTATSYKGARPKGCRYHGDYVARWTWDVAMYLNFAEIKIYDRGKQIGLVEYDARVAQFHIGKFGTTRSKLDPLFDRLFARR
jgi:hypothetical protein